MGVMGGMGRMGGCDGGGCRSGGSSVQRELFREIKVGLLSRMRAVEPTHWQHLDNTEMAEQLQIESAVEQ